MIDLTVKSLPNTVCVGGRDFSIYTDFRKWMRFEMSLEKSHDGGVEVGYLFKNEIPQSCTVDELFAFSRPKNELPRNVFHDSDDVIALDYLIDSDFIYAGFMQQYGIDLTECEMHWHKFLALLRGLTGTKLNEIMQYRMYKKNSGEHVDEYAMLREAWRIEPALTEEEVAELDEFSKLFGG